MSHEIEIDRNAHAVSILDRMEEMMREESLCDFTIKVGSEEIRTHRVVLAAGSDYFRSMLKSDMKESQSGSVNMADIDFECVKICLDFIYNRNVTIPVEKYEDLLYVANMLQLNKFCDYIYTQLDEEMNSQLFFATRRIADMYGHKKLQEKCVKFTEENFASISKEDGFKDLDMEYIHKIISSKNVKLTEDEKLDVVLRFVKVEKKRRKQFEEMIEWVDLGKVSLEHREEIMENEPLVSDNLKIYKIFTASTKDTLKQKLETYESAVPDNRDGHSEDHMLPVDKDLFEFIQLTRSDDLQKIWDQNGSKIDVEVVDDCAYVKIVQNGPLIKFNPSKAKTDLKNLYDDVSATAIQETIDIPKGISGQRIDDAIRLTKTVHKGVHIARVLVTGSRILFIAKAKEDCQAAMKLCGKVFRGPAK